MHASTTFQPGPRTIATRTEPRVRRALTASWALVLSSVFASPATAQAQEIVDTYIDGSVRARYTIDAEGRRSGAYVRFFRNGNAQIRATYSRGVKSGAYQEYHEDGNRKLTCTYKDDQRNGECKEYSEDGKRVVTTHYLAGIKHGPFLVVEGNKTLTKQEWAKGELVLLDGLAPFPRTEKQILGGLERILRAPDKVPGSDRDPILPRRLEALRRLQAYRFLCGLPWEGMVLDPSYNELCDYAAKLCRAIGHLDHTPPRPPGMDEESYRKGYQGTSHSNLSAGSGMVRSVDSYMNDSDERNIARVGHRRWCLNPAMKKTGFGEADGFSAMWSFDASGGGVKGLEAVFYPPQGRVPVGFFGPRHAWSISIVRGRQAKKEDARIEIVPLDEQYLPVGKKLEIDYLGATSSGAGIGNCLIFRPVGVEVQPGRRYWCEVSLDAGKTIAFRYLVEFIADPASGQGGNR